MPGFVRSTGDVNGVLVEPGRVEVAPHRTGEARSSSRPNEGSLWHLARVGGGSTRCSRPCPLPPRRGQQDGQTGLPLIRTSKRDLDERYLESRLRLGRRRLARPRRLSSHRCQPLLPRREHGSGRRSDRGGESGLPVVPGSGCLPGVRVRDEPGLRRMGREGRRRTPPASKDLARRSPASGEIWGQIGVEVAFRSPGPGVSPPRAERRCRPAPGGSIPA
jgi:hypothetical protein